MWVGVERETKTKTIEGHYRAFSFRFSQKNKKTLTPRPFCHVSIVQQFRSAPGLLADREVLGTGPSLLPV